MPQLGLGSAFLRGDQQCFIDDCIIANVVHEEQNKPCIHGVTFCLAHALVGGDQFGVDVVGAGEIWFGVQHHSLQCHGAGQRGVDCLLVIVIPACRNMLVWADEIDS